ncbi:hypothetical protein RN001_012623 [Aquatica leii]|uniref:Uncharacterized protein n=1 Tax=Aquatica leii TaxID=1421715 RepID=A0AAN7P7N6_9COLE|nr:hypothetical protein RN001_012623 [Aquatica leii]
MQTADVLVHEEYVQTITPDASEVQTIKFLTEIYPYDISKPHEEYSQTSPIPSAPPLDEITQTSTPEQPFSSKHELPKQIETTTTETTVQTRPIVAREVGESASSPHTPRDKSYEVYVQAIVTLASDKTEAPEQSTTSSLEITDTLAVKHTHSVDSFSERSESDLEDFDLQVIIYMSSSATSKSLTPEEKQIITPITSIEVQPSEVLVTELKIDTTDITQGVELVISKNKIAVNHKSKRKHKTCITIEEVMSPEIFDTPLTPGTDTSTEVLSPVWTSQITSIVPTTQIIPEQKLFTSIRMKLKQSSGLRIFKICKKRLI